MSGADWQPGDLALCVESNWENLDPSDRDPRHGGLHIVKRVVERRGHVGLVFPEFRYAYLAACFRRIAPLTEPERCAAMRELSPLNLAGEQAAALAALRKIFPMEGDEA